MSRGVVNFENIVSKIVAGGLTAGIFLFWWPTHFATDGIEPLILRGLLSTLFFELVLLSLSPLEARVTERLQRRTAERRTRVRARLEAAPEHARTGGMVALACLSVGAPLALLSGAPHHLVKKPERVEVVRQVVVEKPVVKREVIVKRVTVPGAAAPATAPGSAAPVPERVAAAPVRKAAAKPEAKKATSAKPAPAAPKRTAPSELLTAPSSAPAAKSETTPAPAATAPAPTTGTNDGAPATTGAEQPAPAAQP